MRPGCGLAAKGAGRLTLRGDVIGGFPWVTVPLEGIDGGPVEIRFLVDTGFDGELALPADLLQRVHAFDPATARIQPVGAAESDATYVKGVVFIGDGKALVVDILVRERGGYPLLGTEFMWDHHLSVEFSREGPVALEEL